ncbi:SprB-like repeat protein, partial [Algoriphagus aquaeductus]
MDYLSKIEKSLQPPKVGGQGGDRWWSTSGLNRWLVLMLIFFFVQGAVRAQDGKTIVSQASSFNLVNDPKCPQNNISVDSVQFRNINGQPFDPVFLADNYQLGDLVPGSIWVRIQRSGGAQGYNPHVQYDVFQDGVFTENIATCVRVIDTSTPSQTINFEGGTFYRVAEFQWEYGKEFEIRNFFMTWQTGRAPTTETACPTSQGGGAQCFFKRDGFLVRTPLVARFEYEANCVDYQVKFFDNSTGGDPGDYSWKWFVDLANNGSFSQFSTAQNPTYTFPGPGTYQVKLDVTSEGITQSAIQSLILSQFLQLSTSKVDDDCSDANTGSIDLTVNGGVGPYNYAWTKTGDAGYSFNGQDPSGLSAGTYTVLVTDSRQCTSTTSVTIVKPTQSPAPNGQNFVYCEGDGDQALSVSPAMGYTLKWYDSDMNPLGGAPTVSTAAAGSFTYYISQFKDGECESAKAPINVTINAAPAAPTNPLDITICEGDQESISAEVTVPQGFTIVWYTTMDGNETTDNPTLSTVGSVTYYAASKNPTTGCESLTRTPVTLTINAAPAAPTNPLDITICEGDQESISAEVTVPQGFTIVWYTTMDGNETTDNPTLSTVGSVTYYAASKNPTTGCESLTRTPVTLTIHAAPAAPTNPLDITICEGDQESISASVTVPQGFTIVWYTTLDGNGTTDSPTLSTVGSVTYYAASKNPTTGCESLTRTPVTLTINAAPAAPTNPLDITICEGDQESISASVTVPQGFTIVWYTTMDGNGTTDSPTLSTVGSVTYYAASKNPTTGCESLTRTPVTLTINAAPAAPTNPLDITICEGDQESISASVTVPQGFTIVWYTTMDGNETTDSPTLSTVGSVTYYAASKNPTTGCESLTRTPVTLTINAAPAAPTNPLDITICEGDQESISASVMVPQGFTIVWYTTMDGNGTTDSPTLSTVGSVTYYAASKNPTTGCESLTRTPVTLTIQAAPAAPESSGSIVECEEDPIQTLLAEATVPSGFTLVWYNAPTGGEVVENPILNTVGSVTYYAESVNDETGCKSLSRTAFTLTILDAPAAPKSDGDIIICEGDEEKITASATGPGTIVWYDLPVGGNLVEDPSLSTVGTVTYYAQSIGSSCSSLERTPVTLTINAAPSAPTNPLNVTICEGDQETILASVDELQGFTITWYDAAIGGNVVESPSWSEVGSITYYAESVNDETGCKSLTRTPVTLTINSAPSAPTNPLNVTICEGDQETILASVDELQGFTITWYDAAIGGNVFESPSWSEVGSITYYAESVNDETGCKSLTRTPVTLTINAAPAAPTNPLNVTICEGDQETIQASVEVPQGFTITWYDAAIGGNVVESPSWSEVGSITYYAESVNDETGCKSLTRTPVTLTINAAPSAPTNPLNVTICEGDQETILASVDELQGFTITWYDAAIGGNIVESPSWSQVGSITYYAESVNDETGCKSLTRTPVTLTILGAPVAPISEGDKVECQVSPLQTLTAEANVPQGFSIVWYNAAIGGSVVASPTLNTVGSVTYYAQAVNNETGCESLDRTAVTLTILAAPVAPVSQGNQIVCESVEPQNLVPSALVPDGFSVVWYTAATGGSVVANPSLSTVGTVTYYAQAVNNQTGCASLTRTPVSLTIVQGPTAPVSDGDKVECATFPVQTLTATASAPGTLVWYNAPIGGDVVTNPILNTVGTVTYYAQTVDGSCASLVRTPVTLTILPAPSSPVSGGDQVSCSSSELSSLTATASVPSGF